MNDPILMFRSTLELMVQAYGPQCRDMDENDNEAGHCMYWTLELPCGLKLELVFHTAKNKTEVYSDAPEIEHAIHHLQLKEGQIIARMDRDLLDLFEKEYRFGRWDLFRYDDNGNENFVVSLNTQREAECILDSFEKKGHKQTYILKNRHSFADE